MFRLGIIASFCMGGLLGTGCGGQDAARISEVSAIQAREASVASVRAENQSRDFRVREMERDLLERQRFFEALSGAFVGEVQTEYGRFPIRTYWSSALPPAPATTRTRSWDELVHDLNSQSLSVQIVQGIQSQGRAAVDCTVEGLHPDLNRGTIRVVSHDCRSAFILRIAETEEQAREYARRILSGDAGAVPELFGEVLPGTQVHGYPLHLVRR